MCGAPSWRLFTRASRTCCAPPSASALRASCISATGSCGCARAGARSVPSYRQGCHRNGSSSLQVAQQRRRGVALGDDQLGGRQRPLDGERFLERELVAVPWACRATSTCSSGLCDAECVSRCSTRSSWTTFRRLSGSRLSCRTRPSPRMAHESSTAPSRLSATPKRGVLGVAFGERRPPPLAGRSRAQRSTPRLQQQPA
jgi:hypothetical protein